MVPELGEKVDRGHHGKDRCGNAQKGQRKEEKYADGHHLRNRLPQGTGQIEFLAAVVNDVVVPEVIDLVLQAVLPIPCEILVDEGEGEDGPGGADVQECRMPEHEIVG